MTPQENGRFEARIEISCAVKCISEVEYRERVGGVLRSDYTTKNKGQSNSPKRSE